MSRIAEHHEAHIFMLDVIHQKISSVFKENMPLRRKETRSSAIPLSIHCEVKLFAVHVFEEFVNSHGRSYLLGAEVVLKDLNVNKLMIIVVLKIVFKEEVFF